MARVHLWEWEDQTWMPRVFRDFITDNLHFMAQFIGLFDAVAAKLREALEATGESRIVDLCSGGGGPLPRLVDKLEADHGMSVRATLTDLYPNYEAFTRQEQRSRGKIKGRVASINAFDVPENIEGLRTIFTGFHHFRPEHARRILADAVDKERGIAVFEAQERRPHMVLLVPLAVALASLVATPFAGRMTWGRLFFTYLVPLCPLIYAWDGFVSCLRTYSTHELHELTEGLASERYRFEIGQIKARGPLGFPFNITYLIGIPQVSSKPSTQAA